MADVSHPDHLREVRAGGYGSSSWATRSAFRLSTGRLWRSRRRHDPRRS